MRSVWKDAQRERPALRRPLTPGPSLLLVYSLVFEPSRPSVAFQGSASDVGGERGGWPRSGQN